MDFQENGSVVITATVPNLEKALIREYKTVQIGFNDGRHISPIQRRKIYSLIGEITEFIEGYKNAGTIESTKQTLKMDFILNHLQGMERKMFSLSNVSMSVASDFIDYLVEFILRHDIPTNISLLENCSDIGKYVYQCAANRKCAVCGKAADVHHMEGSRVQAGNDREEVHHLGRSILPLCREHHIECHNSEIDFLGKYHLESITLDEFLCKKLKLKK